MKSSRREHDAADHLAGTKIVERLVDIVERALA
jgi:hypothetical protein